MTSIAPMPRSVTMFTTITTMYLSLSVTSMASMPIKKMRSTVTLMVTTEGKWKNRNN